jgi:hypothetical protein
MLPGIMMLTRVEIRNVKRMGVSPSSKHGKVSLDKLLYCSGVFSNRHMLINGV